MAVLLDTHVWVWWLSEDDRLTKADRSALDRLASVAELRLAAISLWEVQMAYAKGRFVPLDRSAYGSAPPPRPRSSASSRSTFKLP